MCQDSKVRIFTYSKYLGILLKIQELHVQPNKGVNCKKSYFTDGSEKSLFRTWFLFVLKVNYIYFMYVLIDISYI